MWELDYKESWASKNSCFWTVALEKTLESPLNFKEIQPANPKANQAWMFIGRTDAEAETPILWPPDAKNWLTGEDPDAGKDWGQDRGAIEDEMVPQTQQTWVYFHPGRQWRTGKTSMLQFMGLQRARHNLAIEYQEQQNNISLPNKDLFILPRRMGEDTQEMVTLRQALKNE